MNNIKHILFILIIFFEIYITVQKVITIKNDDESLSNLQKIIETYQHDGDLTLNFEDNYYDMSMASYAIEFSVENSITFSGNEYGTIFDYNNDIKGKFYVSLTQNIKTKIKFENIIFENFGKPNEKYYGLFLLAFHLYEHNNSQYIFENCTFRNNIQELTSFINYNKPVSTDEASIIFNGCKFL